jgi:hypothetical protein
VGEYRDPGQYRPEESAVREKYLHKRSYRIVVVKNAVAVRSAVGKAGRRMKDTAGIGINVFYNGGRWIAKRVFLFLIGNDDGHCNKSTSQG